MRSPTDSSDDELEAHTKKNKRGGEEEEEEEEEERGEEEEEGSDDSSSSTSSVAVAKEDAKIAIKKKNAELVSLASENAKLEARIEAAKKKNADKGKELFLKRLTNFLLK